MRVRTLDNLTTAGSDVEDMDHELVGKGDIIVIHTGSSGIRFHP
jgi:hypothetical protein